jgi:hypothetical protein
MGNCGVGLLRFPEKKKKCKPQVLLFKFHQLYFKSTFEDRIKNLQHVSLA